MNSGVGNLIKVGKVWIEETSSEVQIVASVPTPDDGMPRREQVTSPEKTMNALSEAGSAIKDAVANVCGDVIQAFDEVNRPDELKIKFGLKVSGKLNLVFVTEAGGEGTLEIEATWKNDKSESESVEKS